MILPVNFQLSSETESHAADMQTASSRQREAIDKLTDAAAALEDIEAHVLKDAAEDMEAAQFGNAVPVAFADAAMGAELNAYLHERTAGMAETVAETRQADVSDTYERLQGIGELNDTVGSGVDGALAAAVGIALAVQNIKGNRGKASHASHD